MATDFYFTFMKKDTLKLLKCEHLYQIAINVISKILS